MRDKLMPIVNYLQRLGPEHLDQIFEHSRWVFEQDRDIAFEVIACPLRRNLSHTDIAA